MNSTNTIKTILLLAALTAVLVVVGRIIAGPGGMIIALIFALVMNLGVYWFSDKIALSMAGAKEASIDQAPELQSMVERLAVNGACQGRVYTLSTVRRQTPSRQGAILITVPSR